MQLIILIISLITLPLIGSADTTLQNINASGFNVGVSQIWINTPTSYQVIQRSGSSATMTISGGYIGSPTAIEYRWDGGSWLTLDAAPSGGSFTGTALIAQGQATLDVRFSDQTDIIGSSIYVGVGDIFIVAGQSNATGRALNFQTYSSSDGLKASLFSNSYHWQELVDPYDSKVNQIDTVSRDTTAISGSWVLPLATLIMNDQHVPVAFIPCALSGSVISQWATPATHTDRTTLYGSCSYRGSLQPNGIKAILWYQGEGDAQLGTSKATYKAAIKALADGWNGDLNVKTMPTLIAQAGAYGASFAQAIRDAITEAISEDSNLVTGPDLSDLVADDFSNVHLVTDSDMATISTRFYNALNAAGLL